MQWEQEAADILGLPWRCQYWTLETIKTAQTSSPHDNRAASQRTFANWLILRYRYTKWLIGQAMKNDIVLLRHNMYDPFQVIFLVLFGRRCVLVHHTIEDRELSCLGWSSKSARSIAERFCGFFSLRCVAGIIGVTNEIEVHQLARSRRKRIWSATYPNGISSDFGPVDDNRSDVPRFLFLASTFLPWHGLDLLAQSASETDRAFLVDVVGEVPTEIRTQIASDKRFVLHGHLPIREVQEIAGFADLGLSSLALNRMGLTQACALKVRQYLAWGLPSVGSYEETFDSSFPFYEKVSPNIEELLRIAGQHRSTTRQEVATVSRPFIDKTIFVESLWRRLQVLH